MPISSSVPVPVLGPTGFVLPSEADILAGVQADFNLALGGGTNPALNTPQGQIASSTTAIIGDANNQFAAIVNQVDPQFATGRMQDAIGNLYYLTRRPAVPTAVVATVTGLAGVTIPVGAQATTTDNALFVCTGAVTIGVSGTAEVNFSATVDGPIPCPAGALANIYLAIPGWDTITNADDGVLGTNVESPTEFEFRRKQSVALNAQGSLPALYARVFNVPDVIDAYCTENVTDVPLVIGSVTLAPHSVWACVSGGLAADIAEAIWTKKSMGCNYNGSQSAIVYDMSGYEVPYPQYTVSWETADPTPILFAIQLADTPYLPADVINLVKAAVVSAFSGGDGGPVARIASTLYASRYYAPVLGVATPGTVIQILSLALGIGVADQGSVVMGIDQKPTITAANVSVTLVP